MTPAFSNAPSGTTFTLSFTPLTDLDAQSHFSLSTLDEMPDLLVELEEEKRLQSDWQVKVNLEYGYHPVKDSLQIAIVHTYNPLDDEGGPARTNIFVIDEFSPDLGEEEIVSKLLKAHESMAGEQWQEAPEIRAAAETESRAIAAMLKKRRGIQLAGRALYFRDERTARARRR